LDRLKVKSERTDEGFADGCRDGIREQENTHNQTPHIFGSKEGKVMA